MPQSLRACTENMLQRIALGGVVSQTEKTPPWEIFMGLPVLFAAFCCLCGSVSTSTFRMDSK